ncbi:nuclear transport factor 2 family protein [Microbacterium sp. H1-D42]|uniref:nuclear transport factor 2 family protein n=1 Tax=Microbacterium sp. H1-D42 TaxID=2925844 RepID=UPI001F534694|nr:nuclear transport factor 2 family protein [Microbacterium sp. H1-D42]UNK71454.1 nuclear transport factor 2 family protein [Microbacterium sp. H1-D42]
MQSLEFFVERESRVWEALVSGDADADRELLSADFVGVYPTGFAVRDDHVAELAGGPSMASYAISEARIVDVAPSTVMLCYRADYLAFGGTTREAMYISSLWQERDGRWWNTFSQDTPVSDPESVRS